MRSVRRISTCLLFAAVAASAQPPPYLHAPSIASYATHNPAGRTILPDGRFLKPVGRSLPLARWPHGLTISPDGTTLFAASAGVGQWITGWTGASPTVTQLFPSNGNAGAAVFSPDGKTLYWSSGDAGSVYVYNVASGQKLATISLNTSVGARSFTDSYIMDLKRSADGAYLYCADVTNFRVAIIDTVKQQVVGSVDVGRYPYALAVAGKRLYVANIGQFEYQPIPTPSGTFDTRGLTFPAFGYPSTDAQNGVFFEGRQVPGLGDPNAVEAYSVWSLDVTSPTSPTVVHQIKTGLLVGATADSGKAVGGSGPNYLTTDGTSLYVSDGNNDMIERIDVATDKIVQKTRIQPSPLVAKLRGVGPSGMALSPDGKRLYVAESGINAIGVLDTKTGTMLGHIPTAWYPYRVTISPDGKNLGVICFRGFGNGPNGGSNIPTDPYIHMQGVFTALPVPTDSQLAQTTLDVLTFNGIVDKSVDRQRLSSPIIPTTPGKASAQIKYVVFITKENHTFDTIFDHVPGTSSDPTLLRWGLHQTISASGQPTLTNAAVMTNHNALARQFTISDNFYMQPEASGVGHRWLIGVQPNNWCQMTYTLGWGFNANSSAPGRRASFGSNGSIAPEDYPEAGSMWEHMAQNRITFRNYGEGFEFAGVEEGDGERQTGAREVLNIPMSKVVYDNTCRDFPIFNMNIPDQFRATWFQNDFTRLFSKTMPSFINIAICNDHGTGPNASRGYPYVASWMADNDLALGRIVDFLSHTPYWKNMAIFVTQDDSGGEPDHIDAQRSVLLVISPWAKRANVSHRQTTILSMHRTLYEILGLSPLNMFDALANDFSDCFTTTPNYTPYTHVNVDKRIFDPTKAPKNPHDAYYEAARKMPSIRMDDPDEEEKVLQAGAHNR